MSFAVVADVHIGNHRVQGGTTTAGINERCQETLDVLGEALKRAAECDRFIVAGDLFDTATPTVQLITPVMRLFAEFPGEIILLTGNHDRRSDAPGDNALQVFEEAGVATVVSQPTYMGLDDQNLLCVPFQPGPWAPPWPIKHSDGGTFGDVFAIIAHHGIKDKDTPPWLADSAGAAHVDDVFGRLESWRAPLYLSGDWHSRRRWTRDGRDVWQIGALVPTGYDNPGDDGYGTLLIVDDNGDLERDVIPGPRFHVLHDTTQAEDKMADSNNYVRLITADPGGSELDSTHGRKLARQKPKLEAAQLTERYTAGASIGKAIEAYLHGLELGQEQRDRILLKCQSAVAHGVE